MKKLFCILLLLLLFYSPAFATTYYVDNAATGANNGSPDGGFTNDAWQTFGAITGLSGDDIVYISGGAAESSKTYYAGPITVTAGTVDHPITYKIGQVAGHNGEAIFSGWYDGVVNKANVIVSGDAGDGEMHIKTIGSRPISITSKDNVEIEYVNFTSVTRRANVYSGCKNIHIHHCRFYKLSQYANEDSAILYFQVSSVTAGYGDNSFHHNTLYIPVDINANGVGNDGIISNMYSVDIYNNDFIGYLTAEYTDTQHTDGLQIVGGSRIRIFNNTFTNMNNYGIYLHANVSFSDIRIFNNLITMYDGGVDSHPGGIVLTHRAADLTFSDTYVFNNTIVDMGSGNVGIFFNDTSYPNPASPFTDCGVYNNVLVNGGYYDLAPEVDTEDNVYVTAGSAPDTFISYTSYDTENDYNLKSTDTVLNAQGCNTACGVDTADLTAVTTTDIDGNDRSGVWDIAAYAFGGTGAASGTIIPGGCQESDVVDGGKTIVATISGDELVATFGADNAITTAFIQGFDSAQSEGGGWNAKVRDIALTHAAVTRTSATVATVILPAVADYAIEANEIITLTIPGTAVVSGDPIVATPAFQVSAEQIGVEIMSIGFSADGPAAVYDANGPAITGP